MSLFSKATAVMAFAFASASSSSFTTAVAVAGTDIGTDTDTGGVSVANTNCLQLTAPIWKETIGNVDAYPYVDETVQITSQDVDTVTFSVNQLWKEDGTPMVAVHYRNTDEGDEFCDMNAPIGGIGFEVAQSYTVHCSHGYAEVSIYSYVGTQEDFNAEECEACAARK